MSTKSQPLTLESILTRPDTAEYAVRTLGDALGVLSSMQDSRVDFVAHSGNVFFSEGRFQFGGRGGRIRGSVPESAGVERKAIQQFPDMTPAISLSSRYLLLNDPQVAEWNINFFMKTANRPLIFRGWKGEDGEVTIRSICSDKYNVRLDSYDVVRALSETKMRNGGAMQHVFPADTPVIGRIGRDRISLRIPFNVSTELRDMRNGGRSLYQAGFRLTNGETKNSRLTFSPYFMRTSCENSIYVPAWEESGIAIWHSNSSNAWNAVTMMIDSVASLLAPDTDSGRSAIDEMMYQLAEAAMHQMSEEGVLEGISQFTNTFGLNDMVAMQISPIVHQYFPGRMAVAMGITEFANDPAHPLVAADAYRAAAGNYLFTGKFTLPKSELGDGEMADLIPAEFAATK